MNSSVSRTKRGFTLIELLVVIAIIAILAVVVVLTLNPAELLRQSRDANRVSDMATLTSALNLYLTDQSSVSSFSLGAVSSTGISVPDPNASSTCGSLGLPSLNASSGQQWYCSASSSYRNVNNTGWIPVNLNQISAGTPIGSLPIDPTNQTSSGLFYAYNTNGNQFEVTANLESQKYKAQYGQTTQTSLFPEVISGGTPTISALYNSSGLVGYWPMDEGSGSATFDRSGNGNTMQLYGIGWSSGGCKIFNCTQSDNGNGNVAISSSLATIATNNAITVSFWLYSQVNAGQRYMGTGSWCGSYGNWLFWLSGTSMQWDLTNNSGCSSQYVASAPFSTTAWQFITGTFSGSNQAVKLYINGVLQGSTIASGVTFVSSSTAIQEAGNSTDEFDDLRIYNRALSPAEVMALYNAEK